MFANTILTSITIILIIASFGLLISRSVKPMISCFGLAIATGLLACQFPAPAAAGSTVSAEFETAADAIRSGNAKLTVLESRTAGMAIEGVGRVGQLVFVPLVWVDEEAHGLICTNLGDFGIQVENALVQGGRLLVNHIAHRRDPRPYVDICELAFAR